MLSFVKLIFIFYLILIRCIYFNKLKEIKPLFTFQEQKMGRKEKLQKIYIKKSA